MQAEDRADPGGHGSPDGPGAAGYARCIEASRRVRWDAERDVLRGRSFDLARAFLPAGLSKVDELPFLGATARCRLSHLQVRTYAHLFALIERGVGGFALAQAQRRCAGEPLACAALFDLAQGAFKHEALFRRLAGMAAAVLPAGYHFGAAADALERPALAHSRWAVLALIFDIELFTLAHYRASLGASLGAEATLEPVWQDVFLLHWKEESQHAILAELEWRREHALLDSAERDAAVDDLIALVRIVDALLVGQAAADATHFVQVELGAGHPLAATETAAVHDLVRRAYRWQFIVSGVLEPRYTEATRSLLTAAQRQRIASALAPIHDHVAQ